MPTCPQTNTPDPQQRQQLLALAKKFEDAWNSNDAVALAALYTEDAVEVTDQGPIYGREAIEKMYADLFKQVHFSNHVAKPEQYSPHIIGTAGNEAWEIGEFSLTYQVKGGAPIQVKDYWSNITVREGDSWKKTDGDLQHNSRTTELDFEFKTV